MRISKITQTRRGRFALFDENEEFLFSVDGETLVRHHLEEGTLLEPYQLKEVFSQSETRRAKDQALRWLSLRAYASGELYDKLCQKFDEHSAAAAAVEMNRLELLDDEAYAERRAAYLCQKGKSVREIAADLSRKGLCRELIQQVMDELAPDEGEQCYRLVCKSYLSKLLAGQTDKVMAALARRGFSYGEAKRAVERALEEQNLDCDVLDDE